MTCVSISTRPRHTAQLIDGEQRVPQVIKHTEEQHEVELAQRGPVERVGRAANVVYLGAERRLEAREADGVGVFETERDDLGGAAALAFEAEASVPGADVENALPGQVARQADAVAELCNRIGTGGKDALVHLPALVPGSVAEQARQVVVGRRGRRKGIRSHGGHCNTAAGGGSKKNALPFGRALRTEFAGGRIKRRSSSCPSSPRT